MEPPRPTRNSDVAQTRGIDSPNEAGAISSSKQSEPAPSSQRVESTVGKRPTTSGRARILVVEDQTDLRRMLVTALELDGHEVDEAGDAYAGLTHLASARYDLVITDYAMPGETGAWMLREAARLGSLHDAIALIVTAHPGVPETSEIEVIAKPLDIDSFLDQVRRILSSSA